MWELIGAMSTIWMVIIIISAIDRSLKVSGFFSIFIFILVPGGIALEYLLGKLI